jgi:hypothetical protein
VARPSLSRSTLLDLATVAFFAVACVGVALVFVPAALILGGAAGVVVCQLHAGGDS